MNLFASLDFNIDLYISFLVLSNAAFKDCFSALLVQSLAFFTPSLVYFIPLLVTAYKLFDAFFNFSAYFVALAILARSAAFEKVLTPGISPAVSNNKLPTLRRLISRFLYILYKSLPTSTTPRALPT